MSKELSIAEWGLRCSVVLTAARQNRALNPRLRADLDTLLMRFNIWAGSVGVFAPETASADYRLRNDKDIADVLRHLLSRLHENINDVISPPLLEESEEEGEQEEDNSVSDESASTSSLSLSLDENSDHRSEGCDEQKPGQLSETTNGIIDRLYRLSSALRKPVSTSENARVRDFIAKQEQDNKDEVKEQEQLEPYVRWLMKIRFPKAPKYLVDRFAATILFRRMRFLYRKRHQEKLAQGIPAAAIKETADEDLQDDLDASLATTFLPTAATKQVPQGRRPARSNILSGTMASSVNRQRYSNYATSVSMASVTRTAAARGQILDVPQPPTTVDPRLQEIICPYCYRMIPKETAQEPRWTQHILKDVEPYVCLFEECSDSHALFHTTAEWLSHMQWQHTIIWCCLSPGHEHVVKDSRDELEEHLRSAHSDSIPDSQIHYLVERGARPHPDTFGVLAISQESIANVCLICSQNITEKDQRVPKDSASNTPISIQDHYLEHLEALALLALPEGHDVDEPACSNTRNSSNRRPTTVQNFDVHSSSSLKSDNFDDLAVYEDAETYEVIPPNEMPTDVETFWESLCSQLESARVSEREFPEPESDPLLQIWREYIANALIRSGKSTNEQESQQESFASATSANSIDRDKVGMYDSRGWDFEALLGPEISAHRGSISVTASSHTALVRSIRHGDLESLRIQIIGGVDILAQDSDGWCALHHGADVGDGTILGILLESEQVKSKAEHINKADNTGATPLHIAVLRGKEALARQLLEAGADRDALDHFDRSPLFRAVEKNRENLVELLLDYKAKPTSNLLDTKTKKIPNLPKRFLEMESAIKQRKRRSSDPLGLDPKSPRIGSNAKLYLLRQVFSRARKKLSLK